VSDYVWWTYDCLDCGWAGLFSEDNPTCCNCGGTHLSMRWAMEVRGDNREQLTFEADLMFARSGVVMVCNVKEV
jgi:hypothetical protein